MRLTLHTFLTLDGVMQAPGGPAEDRDGHFEHGGWSFPYGDQDFGTAVSGWFDQSTDWVRSAERPTVELTSPRSVADASGVGAERLFVPQPAAPRSARTVLVVAVEPSAARGASVLRKASASPSARTLEPSSPDSPPGGAELFRPGVASS